ncbi:50S ribosomal protein L24 [Candidatus Aerophobetes bacterium]|uniref:Large ribosomal subunit protein uL24 n=1 Tax=Aerophobetes bacterium TaxID=2030807 RepID=A0A2A4X7B3_UNCAE|nr:MAG: 50S ribosomal protein L24 [Candidatus Aerophobetes bacterium]
MKNKWIKQGDTVLVIAGNDKGKSGEVLARKQERILIRGVNMRKKHMKAKKQGQKSDIVEIELPIHISNVAICNSNGEKIKLGVSFKKGSKEKELVIVGSGKNESFRKLR